MFKSVLPAFLFDYFLEILVNITNIAVRLNQLQVRTTFNSDNTNMLPETSNSTGPIAQTVRAPDS